MAAAVNRAIVNRAPSRWGPLFGRPIALFLAHVYWRTSVRRARLVPRKGPVVVIANHVGFIDGPIAVGATPRNSHFLVKKDMFKGPLGPILKWSGQIKVEGGGREALARAREVLRRGGLVGVFPEGTRGAGDAASLAGGAAWLALHGNAPVVPLALLGTRHTGESVNIWPRPCRKIIAEFGEPIAIEAPTTLSGRDRQRHAEELVAQALREHVLKVERESGVSLPADDPLRERKAS